MTNHNAFNEGLTNAARNHYRDQPSIFATNEQVDAWVRQQEALKKSVAPYKPAHVIEYAPPPPKPFAPNNEAEDEPGLIDAAIYLVPRVIGGGLVATGVAYIWGLLKGVAIAATATGTAIATPAAGVSTLTMVGCGVGLLAFLAFCISGMTGDSESKAAPAQNQSGTSQTINVVVNVAGGDVSTTTNGKL